MTLTPKKSISDYAIIILGSIGFLLGLLSLLFPELQYKSLGLDVGSVGNVIPGLMSSAGLSAIYIGLMYIFGTLQKWRHFKLYLVFARTIMAIGFAVLFLTGKATEMYIFAALWEAVGVGIIAFTLWWDKRKFV